MQHSLALLRVQAVQQGFGVEIQIGHVQTHVGPNLPPSNDTFCAATAVSGTLIDVLIQQQRFFYGYRPAVPAV
ncbi:MAG: hypothetical protein NVS4B6_29830 [Mycobacterium sp.]